MKQPTVTPIMTGGPKRADSVIKQSDILSWIGPKDTGAKAKVKAAYKLATETIKADSWVRIVTINLLPE